MQRYAVFLTCSLSVTLLPITDLTRHHVNLILRHDHDIALQRRRRRIRIIIISIRRGIVAVVHALLLGHYRRLLFARLLLIRPVRILLHVQLLLGYIDEKSVEAAHRRVALFFGRRTPGRMLRLVLISLLKAFLA